jgi:hypothetical protein
MMRWLVFVVLLVGTCALSWYLTGLGKKLIAAGTPGAIVDLELAWKADCAKSVVTKWNDAGVTGVARHSIHVDFAFIFCYSLLLAMVCQAASSHLHGAWQTAGVVLAWGMLAAGVLDCIENIGMLTMLHGNYGPVRWVSLCAATKFVILIVSVIYIVAAHLAR